LLLLLQVAIIKEAGLSSQMSWVSCLGRLEADLGELLPSLSPCVVVVGQVVGLPAKWRELRQQHQAQSQQQHQEQP